MKKKFINRIALIALLAFATLEVGKAAIYQEASIDTLNFIQRKQHDRLTQMADNHYEGLAYTKSIDLYRRALKVSPSNDTLKLKIASAYFQTNNLDSAYVWYEKVIRKEPLIKDKIHYINFAETLAGLGKYEEASYWYAAYQQTNPNDKRVTKRIKGFENVLSFYKDSVRYTLSPVSFNTKTYDFSPCYYQDQILFVSARETHGVSQ